MLANKHNEKSYLVARNVKESFGYQHIGIAVSDRDCNFMRNTTKYVAVENS